MSKKEEVKVVKNEAKVVKNEKSVVKKKKKLPTMTAVLTARSKVRDLVLLFSRM